MEDTMKRNGLALIVVIGILGVLAVLAVAFVAMAQLERRASMQRVNAARAYLLARSGIEDALARLGLGQDAMYGGENWDGLPDGRLSAFEASQEVYRRTGAGTPADIEGCPVKHAMRPSFFARLSPTSGEPALVKMDGKSRGYSGRLAGDHAERGNSYALKVKGGNEGFYINGGDPSVHSDPTAVSDYNTNLRRMLGILAKATDEVITQDMKGINPTPPPPPPGPSQPPPTGTGVNRAKYWVVDTVDTMDEWPGAQRTWGQNTADDAVQAGHVESYVAFSGILDEPDGWALIDRRPSTGWQSWDQVRKLALGGSQAKLDALRPYLTLHAWVDKKVIAPNAVEPIPDYPYPPYQPQVKGYHSWGEFKLDHRETRPGSKAPDFERIRGRIVGRAPVDLAWARARRPALIALLGGLKGLYLDETAAKPILYNKPSSSFFFGGDLIGILGKAELSLAWSAADDCHQIANRILDSAIPIATWQQWNDFCDALPDSVIGGSELDSSPTGSANPARALLTQAKRDLLKANFNPNTRLNKFSPNRSLWQSVDKSDLLGCSTEFSLLPAAGPRHVSCVGRVAGPGGRLLASRILGAEVAGLCLFRLTTQREFVCQELGDLHIAGDETGVRLPGESPFITLSRDTYKTWGYELPGMGDQGVSLQVYPEPCVDAGSGLEMLPADYDGSLQLATIETPRDWMYGVPAQTRDMTMLARYTTSFDLDVADAAPDGGAQPPPLFINPKQNHPDVCQVTSHCAGEPTRFTYEYGGPWKATRTAYPTDLGPPRLEELRYSILHDANDYKLNTLYPDGCYSEKDRAPEYLDKGNADGFHGVMSFWVKANHVPPLPVSGGDNYSGSRGHPFVKWTNFNFADDMVPTNGPNQFFCLGDAYHAMAAFGGLYGGQKIPAVYAHFEIGHEEHDEEMEHQFHTAAALVPHRWHLLTFRWDFLGLQKNDTGELVLDGGLPGEGDKGSVDIYTGGYNNPALSNNPAWASDITADDIQPPDGKATGPHRIGLGRGHPEWEAAAFVYFGTGADATFDEFAIYDFGGAMAPVWTTDVTRNGSVEAFSYNLGYSANVGLPSPDTLASPSVLALNRFREGRYYKASAYAGLSGLLYDVTANTAAQYFSAPIRLGAGARIRALAWTQVVPRSLRSPPVPLMGNTNVYAVPVVQGMDGDPSPPDGAISFDLANLDGTDYARDAQGRAIAGPLAPLDSRFTDDAFSPVDRIVTAPFRLHAVFQPNLADPINTPILDPLTLDDVTVYYESLGGPRVVAYESDPEE